jgi:hypothetical protein
VVGLDIFTLPSTKEIKKKKDDAKKKTSSTDTTKTTGTQPSAEAQAAQGGITVGQGGGTTLSGLPKGTQITGAGTATYEKGAGALKFAQLGLNDRATLLLRMGQVPGLYATGQAPTPDFIKNQIKTGNIVPRAEDFAALEKIAAISDWTGDTTDNTVIKLTANPKFAEQFFGKVTTTAKAVSSAASLEAGLNNKFLDLFETKADPELVKAYTKEVNALESSKAGASTQQKEDILLKYIQKKADSLYNIGKTGMAPGVADKGALGRRVRNLRQAYDDNGLPYNEKDIYSKAVQSLRSEDEYKNIIDGVMMQAGSVMPAFKDLYAKGKTAREALSPWISLRAQILQIPEDQIKTSDMYDVGSGAAPMSIQDYKRMLYKSDAYKKTDAYKQTTLGDMKSLLSAFNIGG